MTLEEKIAIINEKIENERIKAYPLQVLNNEIVTNRYIKLAVDRFVCFLLKYGFNERKILSVMKFCESLNLTAGQFNGRKLSLMGWQIFLISNIYGFVYENGLRVTRNVYCEVARKSAKTATLSAIALYELLKGENESEIYCLSPTREQSKILFSSACRFADGLDPNQQYIRQLRNEIKFKAKYSFIKAMSGDSRVGDGYRPQCFVCDELHALKDDSIWSVFKTGQGAQREPLAIAITSAGNDTSSFCYTTRTANIEILDGMKEDDSQFSLIYCLEKPSDIEDEKNWVMANPSIGVTVSVEYLREQYNQAKNNNSLRNYIFSRNFGVWSKTVDIWISDDLIAENMENFDPIEQFKDYQVYCGVDLSAVSDLTSVSYLCVVDNHYHFYTDYFLPSETIDTHANSIYYRNWVDNNMLHATPDNAIDYSVITESILSMRQSMIIRKVGYDRYLSPQWAEEMSQNNFNMEIVPQTLGTFSAPTKELERLIKNGQVTIHKNPVTRWCFSNVTLKEDHNQNVKPCKTTKNGKIDGTISMIMALYCYMKDRKQTPDLTIIR